MLHQALHYNNSTKEQTMHWSDYRCKEGAAVIINHPNYTEQPELKYSVSSVSSILADFMINAAIVKQRTYQL